MKTICCVALLFAGYAQAGDLLPMSGRHSRHMQDALNKTLPDVVAKIPGITVEPYLESISIDGPAKKLLLGPIAGGGNVVLRIKITDSAGVTTEEVISDRSSAWRGTFQPRTDLAMLRRVADRAAYLVRSKFEAHLRNSDDDSAARLDADHAVPAVDRFRHGPRRTRMVRADI